jgi:N-acetylneuraminic acid mutarotase/LysM repeat protein
MGGSNTANQTGVYGTPGTPAAANFPGARYSAVSWTDSGGNRWLFGGYGYAASSTVGYFNDFWVMDPSTNQWAWMGGSESTDNQIGVYGTLGTPAAGNVPGSRGQALSWTDSSGHLWLFGGIGYGVNGTLGYLNDLWEYQPSFQPPSIATPKVTVTPSSTSITTLQALSVTVVVGQFGTVIPTGSVVLSGGGYTSPSTALVGSTASFSLPAGSLAVGSYTFTASYTPDSAGSATYAAATGTSATVTVALPVAATPVFSLPGGSYSSTQTVTLSDATAGATIYYAINGTPTTSSTQYSGGTITVSSSETLEAIAVLSGYTNSAVASAGYLISPLAVGGALDWTWISGSSTVNQRGVYGTLGAPAAGNIPGSRFQVVSRTDNSGHLWLFGGLGYDANGNNGVLNDLWEFNPSIGQWTWIGGSGTVNQSGVYGTLGAAAAGNVPGSRSGAVSWTDSSGHFWLFGGCCYSSTGDGGYLNDLWELNPLTNQWAWMGGSNTSAHSGVYGTLGMPAAGNIPGARGVSANWTDSGGHLWLFGGYGYGASSTAGYLNDLWVLNPSTNQWAWMGGSNTVNQSGVYGTLGTAAGGNIPGGRSVAASWTDNSGHLWLFGGGGYGVNGTLGYLNDLWEYQPPSAFPLAMPQVTVTPSSTSITTIQPLTITVVVGEFGSVTPTGSVVLTSGGYTSPSTALVGGSATFNLPAGSLAVGSYTFTASYTPDSAGSATYAAATGTSATVTVALPVAATPVFSVPAGSYSSTQTVTLSDATAGATIYYAINGTPTTSSTQYSGGTITVSSSETLEAIAVLGGYTNSAVASAGYLISPLAVGGALDWTWMGGSNTANQPGVYGTLGTPAAGNIPGGRNGASIWTDSTGHLWLFGGQGYGASANRVVPLNDLWEFNPSTNQWAWMGGSNTSVQSGVYGTLGMPAAGDMPGGRFFAASWIDGSGNLWLFGGFGEDAVGSEGLLNDLWEFNPATNQWAWMGGSSTISTSPPGRAGVYGTLGTPAAGNIPGSREYATSWTDSSGHLWLFGGTGYDVNDIDGGLNDLWEFNPSTNQWAWMGGSNSVLANFAGVYGTLGSPAAGNIPGSRSSASSWTDSRGNFWLFAGYGYDTNGTIGYLNDLWEFNPSTNQWTWMGGSSTVPSSRGGRSGVYGTVGTPATGSIPGGRVLATSWLDNAGNLWLFGGEGYDVNGALGYLTDLWVLNPSANQWAWVGGSENSGNTPGVYGTLGTPVAGNIPGSRQTPVNFADSSGHLWLFGGLGYDVNGTFGELNDLWEYQPPSSQLFTSQAITFTPLASPVTYGVAPIALAATGGASGNPVVFSVVSGPGTISGSTLTITGAGTVVVAANQAGNSSYWGAAQVTQSIVVNPATLNVSVLGTPTLVFGEPTPSLPYTIGPFVNGDTQASATTGAPTLTTTAVPRSAPGSYPITVGVGTLAAANYIFTTTNGSFNVVGGAAQSILFPALANFTNGTSVSLVAVATSGLPVTFTVASGPASISGSTLTITGTGPVSITASQTGNANFAAATPVTQSFVAQ